MGKEADKDKLFIQAANKAYKDLDKLLKKKKKKKKIEVPRDKNTHTKIVKGSLDRLN
jgi:hypothetical protein